MSADPERLYTLSRNRFFRVTRILWFIRSYFRNDYKLRHSWVSRSGPSFIPAYRGKPSDMVIIPLQHSSLQPLRFYPRNGPQRLKSYEPKLCV